MTKPGILVILTPGFPSDETDTACLPAQQVFVRALNRNFPKLRVVLISFEYPHRRDHYEWFGNTVFAVGGWKKGMPDKLLTCITVWRMLGRLRKEHQLLGLLSFWCSGCALLGKYYAGWNRLTHFIWILGQDARRGNRYVPLIRPAGGELVAMSNFLAAEFYLNYKIHPHNVIPNGVDASLYGPPATVRDIDILGVGSLIRLKQYDLFISVIQRLSAGRPGIRATICGKGPEQANLQLEIDRSALGENLKLVGEKPHRTAIGLMQRAKILLHTSNYEGFSTVCLEALYAGAHVISFCDPEGRQVKNWHVVSTTEEMVARASALLGDPQTVYEPVQLHTMDDSARAMMALYGHTDAGLSETATL